MKPTVFVIAVFWFSFGFPELTCHGQSKERIGKAEKTQNPKEPDRFDVSAKAVLTKHPNAELNQAELNQAELNQAELNQAEFNQAEFNLGTLPALASFGSNATIV